MVNARLAKCLTSILNVKAVVAAFNKEKALVGAFSVITNLRMELFEALLHTDDGFQQIMLCSAQFVEIVQIFMVTKGRKLAVL